MSSILKATRAASVMLVGLFAFVACQESGTAPSTPSPILDLTDLPTDNTVFGETHKVCKVGTDASFDVSRDPPSAQFSSITVDVADGNCKQVAATDKSDPFELTITELVPAGYTVDRIEFKGRKPGSNTIETQTFFNTTSVSFLAPTEWVATVSTFYNVPEEGGEGCTPGFWKTKPHQDDWAATDWNQTDVYDAVFGVDNLVDPALTLLGAVDLNGNDYNSFVRHSVAALLNAAHPDVSYDLTEAEVIQAVQDAHDSGDFDSAKYMFQGFNEQFCPIS